MNNSAPISMKKLKITINLDEIEGNVEAQVNFVLKGLAKGVMAARMIVGQGSGMYLSDYHGKHVGKMEIINE